MAALDTFHSFNEQLTDDDRRTVQGLLEEVSEELLRLRSEDARLRAVGRYIEEVRSQIDRNR